MGTTGMFEHLRSCCASHILYSWVLCRVIGMLLIGCFLLGEARARETVERIVAYVNDDIILLSQLNDEMAPYAERVRQMNYSPEAQDEMIFKLREDMLNRLVEQQLTDQEIQKAGISINDAEIEQSIERLKQSNRMTEEMLIEALKKQGMTLDEYRNRLKEQMLRSRLVSREVKSKIVVTDEDIKQYYETHLPEFSGDTMIHLRHLTLSLDDEVSQYQREAARRKMESVLMEIESGTPFQEIEARFNDQTEGERSGDLGSFPVSTLSPTIQQAIGKIQAGGATELLQTDQGYQIFYIEQVTPAEVKKLEDVSASISEKIYKERVDERFARWLEDLKKTALIKKVL